MMPIMLTVSLWLNVLVLIPVCLGLVTDAQWANGAWGERTPARGIMLSIYFAILLGSGALLVLQSPVLAAPILAAQVAYKITTPLTVRTLRNPVVLSNLAIAAVHCVTLVIIAPQLPL